VAEGGGQLNGGREGGSLEVGGEEGDETREACRSLPRTRPGTILKTRRAPFLSKPPFLESTVWSRRSRVAHPSRLSLSLPDPLRPPPAGPGEGWRRGRKGRRRKI